MQDPNFIKYLEYFDRLPSARMYYYFIGEMKRGVTAKELSQKMKRSIQTVTNALRDLEREGLLKSQKVGRKRIYELRDPRLYKGLMEQTIVRIQTSGRKIKEDQLSIGIFNENIRKWLSYLSDMMEGTLYTDWHVKTHVMDTPVDYVIENKHGQHFIIFFNIADLTDYEAAIGRIFSLATSRDIIPNLFSIVVVGLVYDKEIIGSIETGFRRLFDHLEQLEKFELGINLGLQVTEEGDFIKAEFAEKVSSEIARRMPFFGDEAMPGEDWGLNISSRRRRALEFIQSRVNPKAVQIMVFDGPIIIGPPSPSGGGRITLHELLPRDAELKRWLNPEEFLVSHGLKAGKALLDVACFDGLFTMAAANIVGSKGKVYAFDLFPASVEKIRLYTREKNISNITVEEGLPEKTIFGDDIADLAFIGITTYYLYNPVNAFKNIHRMLKDKGRLVVLEWKKGIFGVGPSDEAKLSREQIEACLEAAGFTVETIEDEGDYLYSITAVKINAIKKSRKN